MASPSSSQELLAFSPLPYPIKGRGGIGNRTPRRIRGSNAQFFTPSLKKVISSPKTPGRKNRLSPMKSTSASSFSSPMKAMKVMTPKRSASSPMKAMKVTSRGKAGSSSSASSSMKVMSPKAGAKPVVKRAWSSYVNKKETWDLFRAQINMEWTDLCSYNKSFGCSPPTAYFKFPCSNPSMFVDN